jgi:hypothetical protein
LARFSLGFFINSAIGLLTSEAIGFALELRIDGAVGLYVFTHCKAHRARVAVLAGKELQYSDQATARLQ